MTNKDHNEKMDAIINDIKDFMEFYINNSIEPNEEKTDDLKCDMDDIEQDVSYDEAEADIMINIDNVYINFNNNYYNDPDTL